MADSDDNHITVFTTADNNFCFFSDSYWKRKEIASANYEVKVDSPDRS